MNRLLGAILAMLLATAAGCDEGGAVAADAGDTTGADADVSEVAGGFDDHTVGSFATVADFLAYAGAEQAPAQVKFLIRGFSSDPDPTVHFEHPGFFAMHDEWGWFTLLNGQPIPGYDQAPVNGQSFATITDVVAWAKKQAKLPLDLTWVNEGNRLYSPHFYDRCEGAQRFFGPGSVMHLAPNAKRPAAGELWFFELEFLDVPDVKTVVRYFDVLIRVLPPEVGSQLRWLARNAAQEEVAKTLKASGSAYGDRTLTLDDLVVQGDSRAYNNGIAAGRVLYVPKGSVTCAMPQPTDVLILEEVPDDLPPVAAIVTAVPQTPLAHIGLLAKARGTPNGYLAGVKDLPEMETWAYYRTPVMVRVTDKGVELTAMTNCDGVTPTAGQTCKRNWEQYVTLLGSVHVEKLVAADLAGVPETFDLTSVGLDQMPGLVKVLGGKSSGFLGLNGTPGLDLPDQPLGLTVVGYAQHVARLDPTPEQILADWKFKLDTRIRYLVLEGRDAFTARFAGCGGATALLADFDAKWGPGTVLGKAVAAGGLKRMIRDLPMDAGYLARLTDALKQRFGFLAHSQGLRFRSSSTTEDVEGFNGAGLYESHTAFLYPEEQASPSDQKKTIEETVKQVWSTYWLAGAYEERQNAKMDHLAGRMGMAVHPVFDDDKELGNGVMTLELVRRPDGDIRTLTANAQKGFLSVTNPPPGSPAAPEIDVVRVTGDGAPTITRKQASTEVPAGTLLLSDAELTQMLGTLGDTAARWLDVRNTAREVAKGKGLAMSTLTLDVEFKQMAAGWPARIDGVVNPARFVIKQARSLETPLQGPDNVTTLRAPRDILGRATRVEQRSCMGGWFGIQTVELYTDPADLFPFDYSKTPFGVYFAFPMTAGATGFDFPALKDFVLLNPEATATYPGYAEGGPWALDLQPHEPTAWGFDRVAVDASGKWSIEGPPGLLSGQGNACFVAPLTQNPKAFLESLLGAL